MRLVITYGAIAHSRAAACIFRLRAAAGSLINLYANIVVVFNLEQSQVIGTNFRQPLNKLLTAYVYVAYIYIPLTEFIRC